MAKRVINHRQEVEITDEEAKQCILDGVFTCVGSGFMVENFKSRAIASGLEGNLEKLLNELIKEGKLRIEYEYISGPPMSGPGWVLVIKRIA